jgi:hypothetical protein
MIHLNIIFTPPPPSSLPGEAVAEFSVYRRVEIDTQMWCLVQVAEHVDVEVPSGDMQTSAVEPVDEERDAVSPEPIEGETKKPASESVPFTRQTRQRFFWVPENLYIARLGLDALNALAAMPETVEASLERRLKEKYDKSITLNFCFLVVIYLPLPFMICIYLIAGWTSATASFHQTVSELTARLQTSEANLEQALAEHRAYKDRAHIVLQQQEEQLSKLPGLQAVAGEVDTLHRSLHEANQRWESAQASLKLVEDLTQRLTESDKRLETVIESSKANDISWKRKIRDIEQQKEQLTVELQKEQESLVKSHELQSERLREELNSFRQKARQMLQSKDTQISSLTLRLKSKSGLDVPSSSAADSTLDVVSNVDTSASHPEAAHSENLFGTGRLALPIQPAEPHVHAVSAEESLSTSSHTSSPSVSARLVQLPSSIARAAHGPEAEAESEIVHLAAMQAQRDDELHRHRQHIRRLQQLLREQEASTSQLQVVQEEYKTRIKDLERSSKRSGANMEYLKNMVVSWMEDTDSDQILSVIATILQFSPEELTRIKEKRKSRGFKVNQLLARLAVSFACVIIFSNIHIYFFLQLW